MANEKRLIDANVLVRKVNKLEVFYFTGETDIAVHDCQMVEFGGVLAEIDEAPTVDAVEVVHGCWYKAPHHPYRCSNCGEMALLDMYGESHFRSNYCPNCGAKMDGDGNG